MRLRRLLVHDDEDRTGWTSSDETVTVSSLGASEVLLAVCRSDGPVRALGLEAQLQPLAELLADTALGHLAPRGRGPTPSKDENVRLSFLEPLALHYVKTLADVAVPDPDRVERLCDELDELIERGDFQVGFQLAVDGIHIDGSLAPHRGVALRALTPSERGAWVETRAGGPRDFGPVELAVPQPMEMLTPRALFMWSEPIPTADPSDEQMMQNRLALALFLRGHQVSAPGVVVKYDEPRWAAFGTLYSPFEVQPTALDSAPRTVDQTEFEAIVELAHATPRFSSEEGNPQEVALYRTLRGLGAKGGGFLDLAIALEAALLAGTTTELAFKFRLYGALFCPGDDPAAAFADFKQIYAVRSNLAHGSPVSREKHFATEKIARRMVVTVIRQAIEGGWPDAETLERKAIGLCQSATAP